MKARNIATAVEVLLDDFFRVQKDINHVSNLYSFIMKEVELAVIKKVMKLTYRNKTKTAKILGISRNTLNAKLKQNYRLR